MQNEALTSITLRTLAPQEVEKWLDFMCNEVFPDDPRENVETMWRDDPVKDLSGTFVAVDTYARIISSVKVSCRQLSLCGASVPTGIIAGVGTRRDCRGQCIIGRLFALCDNCMRERNVPLLHLYSNADTVGFYRKQGYLSLPQRPGEDFFRMYRVLTPFTLGNQIVTDTEALMQILQAAPDDNM